MDVAADPAGQLIFVTPNNRSALSRQAKAGAALRLAAGVYAAGCTISPEAAAREHRLAIVAHIWPGAVVCGRSALAGALPVDGWLYLAHPNPDRGAPLHLPGLTLAVQIGPAALPGDMALPGGLAIAGRARTFVENIDVQGRRPRSRAGTVAVEDRIDELARTGGAGAIRSALGELDVIAPSFDPRAVEAVRGRLAAALGTFATHVSSDRLRARLDGAPYDSHRIHLLDDLIGYFHSRAPEPRPATGGPHRWAWLPFFEAYFSNFIEGTEFSVEEARRIAIDNEIPADRPADAHDVAATYRLASDAADSRLTPRDAGHFLDILRARHRVLMAARPDKRPGALKVKPNYAGGYRFVDPELAEGTLRRGFDRIAALVDPFARAVATMALITECHPFDDGNGRVARLTANAELSAAGQVRIVIPTVYRNNYIVGLNAFSNRAGVGESLDAVLRFAQRWTGAVDWASFDLAGADLEASDAYMDPGVADATGRRLRIPQQ